MFIGHFGLGFGAKPAAPKTTRDSGPQIDGAPQSADRVNRAAAASQVGSLQASGGASGGVYVTHQYQIRKAEESDLESLVAFTLQEAKETEGVAPDLEAVRRGVQSGLEGTKARRF